MTELTLSQKELAQGAFDNLTGATRRFADEIGRAAYARGHNVFAYTSEHKHSPLPGVDACIWIDHKLRAALVEDGNGDISTKIGGMQSLFLPPSPSVSVIYPVFSPSELEQLKYSHQGFSHPFVKLQIDHRDASQGSVGKISLIIPVSLDELAQELTAVAQGIHTDIPDNTFAQTLNHYVTKMFLPAVKEIGLHKNKQFY